MDNETRKVINLILELLDKQHGSYTTPCGREYIRSECSECKDFTICKLRVESSEVVSDLLLITGPWRLNK